MAEDPFFRYPCFDVINFRMIHVLWGTFERSGREDSVGGAADETPLLRA